MRPITRTTMCALVAAAVAAPAVAASSNYYLRLDDIKSKSADGSTKGKPLEILSWSWGATQAVGVNLNSSKSNAAKFGAISGLHRDDSIAPVRGNAARGAAGPLDRGSVRVKVKFPWLDCKVGAAFPDAVLHNSAGRYELKDVQVTSCSSGGDRPMDSLSLNYAKVTVRGWDSDKK